ncbi:hypothetical protein [Streptomyces endocoffeicus]|uniref:hypothetical protein n=1 Tax=Streptomyces endocoffeicus TaxID=2898945 RepID=UPI001E2BC4A3|nr:hypothetical protein [Streptomyces endocoffeicus]
MNAPAHTRTTSQASPGGVALPGIPLVDLSLRRPLGREGVDALLLGGSRVEHLRADLAAAGGPFPGQGVRPLARSAPRCPGLRVAPGRAPREGPLPSQGLRPWSPDARRAGTADISVSPQP